VGARWFEGRFRLGMRRIVACSFLMMHSNEAANNGTGAAEH